MRPILIAILAFVFAATTALAEAPLPISKYFANKDRHWDYKISPNGQQLAWFEVRGTRSVLKLRDLDSGKTRTIKPSDRLTSIKWAGDSRFLYYQADVDGRENFQLVTIDTQDADAKERRYNFGKGTVTRVLKTPRDGSSDLFISHNARDAAQFDAFRLNLETGAATPLAADLENDVRYFFDDDGTVFAKRVLNGAAWRLQTRACGWCTIARGSYADQLWLIGARTGSSILAQSNIGRNTVALVRLNLRTGRETVIERHQSVDIEQVFTFGANNDLLATNSYPTRQNLTGYQPIIQAVKSALNYDPTSQNLIVYSYANDLSRIVFVRAFDQGGPEYLLYDRAKHQITTLFKAPLRAQAARFANAEPQFIRAKDGLKIPAFLYRSKSTKPGPLIINIHGGPIVRVFPGYNPFFAAMVDRGYSVLDVNYRGSVGYGRRFANAAKGEVARKMHQDIVDVRAWAVAQGIADPARVGVIGGSWGGFQTMSAMVETPDLFAAGVAINGVSDMSTMLDEVPPYWRGWVDWYRDFIGDPVRDKAKIFARSPLSKADRVTGAIMIVQGANDTRVVRSQSDRFVQALTAANIPHTYNLVKRGGHITSNWPWQKRLLMYRDIEVFFGKHLGGQVGRVDLALTAARLGL